MSRLKRVEPVPRGRLFRAYTRTAASPAGTWLSRNVVWKVDPFLLRLSGGRFGFGVGLPAAMLETKGARSGQPRTAGVLYFHDGDRVILVASKSGMPEHPAWFHNAVANPEVELNGIPFRAEVVDDERERERLWALADNAFPPFATYRERAAATGRTIPILRLVPRLDGLTSATI